MLKQKITICVLLLFISSIAHVNSLVPYPKLVLDPKKVYNNDTLIEFLKYLKFYKAFYGKQR